MVREFESLLGENIYQSLELFGTDLIPPSKLPSEEGTVIALYFCAHWSGPCQEFTPKLIDLYKEIRAAGHKFHVVFIPWDRDSKVWKEQYKTMPWMSIPYDRRGDDRKLRKVSDACTKYYDIRQIPALALIDGATGDTINVIYRDPIDSFGAAGFPYSEAKLNECKKEEEANKAKALEEMASLMLPLTTNEVESKVELQTAVRSCDALAIAFVDGSNCEGTRIILPKLADVQETLGKSKINIIIIPTSKEEFDDNTRAKIKDIPVVKYGKEITEEIVKKFKAALLEINVPHIFVLTAGDESTFKVYSENACREIHYHGAAGFPWTPDAIDAMKLKEEAYKEEIKSKQKDFEFFASGEQSHIVDKNGDVVALTTLQSKEVVAIYFGAKWCGPCETFCPKIAELYNKCKEQDKKFEVIFVSNDRDKAAFDEYYEKMPWCVLPFAERRLKNAIYYTFGVQGIPRLFLLTGHGEIITEHGKEIVEYGIDYYPWSKEDMERGLADKLGKAKEAKNDNSED